MTKLIAPNGSTVSVSDEKAKRLLGEGYKAAGDGTKATAKKASSSKSEK